jgi:hypothetical protein
VGVLTVGGGLEIWGGGGGSLNLQNPSPSLGTTLVSDLLNDEGNIFYGMKVASRYETVKKSMIYFNYGVPYFLRTLK